MPHYFHNFSTCVTWWRPSSSAAAAAPRISREGSGTLGAADRAPAGTAMLVTAAAAGIGTETEIGTGIEGAAGIEAAAAIGILEAAGTHTAVGTTAGEGVGATGTGMRAYYCLLLLCTFVDL